MYTARLHEFKRHVNRMANNMDLMEDNNLSRTPPMKNVVKTKVGDGQENERKPFLWFSAIHI